MYRQLTIMERAQADDLRRALRAAGDADRADRLLAEFHGETARRERDWVDDLNEMLDGRT